MKSHASKAVVALLCCELLIGCAQAGQPVYLQAAAAQTAAPARTAAPAPTLNPRAMTIIVPARYTSTSYRGRPDLGLLVALVEAGGGRGRFDSTKLLTVMAGGDPKPEVERLQKQYGHSRMDAFMQTFTFSMIDLLEILAYNHIALPRDPRIAPGDGRALTLAAYHDGIMLDGRFDCGYMMDHLMSRPVHIALMHDIDNVRGFGPSHNASFHTILTRAVVDLKNQYLRHDRPAR